MTSAAASDRQIENLIARYAFLVDDGDFAGLGELRTYADGTPRTRHVTTNLIIDVDDESGTATSRSYFTVMQQADGFPLQPVAAGRYRDAFDRHDGSWRFTSRTVGDQLFGDLGHHVKAAVRSRTDTRS